MFNIDTDVACSALRSEESGSVCRRRRKLFEEICDCESAILLRMNLREIVGTEPEAVCWDSTDESLRRQNLRRSVDIEWTCVF